MKITDIELAHFPGAVALSYKIDDEPHWMPVHDETAVALRSLNILDEKVFEGISKDIIKMRMVKNRDPLIAEHLKKLHKPNRERKDEEKSNAEH